MEVDEKFECQSSENESLIKEIRSHYILHWNYRGYQRIPQELLTHGAHVLELYFKENGLHQLPDDLDQHLNELTNLYLHGNLLERLPVTLTRIRHLSVLEISRNRISDLPVEIGNLGCLITLDLSNNLIESLPDSIGDLTHLQNLILIRNNLKNVPSTIGKLKNLTSLHLSGNQLKHLPEEISGCQSLIDLYVGANKLTCLPRSIANLSRLAHLCTSINQLESLPLLPFVSLPRVFFDYNPAISHLPFVFGCQQNVAAFSAQRRQWIQGQQTEENSDPKPRWKFQIQGCFQTTTNDVSTSKDSLYIVDVKKQNDETGESTKIRIDENLRIVQTFDVSGGQIFGAKSESTTLKEFCLRATYKLFFGENSAISRSLGQKNGDLIYVRKQPQMTEFGKMILNENCLPIDLQNQLTVKGPTTLCCHPFCVRPIFGCCSIVLTGFKPEPDPDFEEIEPNLRPKSPFITSLYFCGPWCVDRLMTCQKESCLKLKLAILSCDISIRKVI